MKNRSFIICFEVCYNTSSLLSIFTYLKRYLAGSVIRNVKIWNFNSDVRNFAPMLPFHTPRNPIEVLLTIRFCKHKLKKLRFISSTFQEQFFHWWLRNKKKVHRKTQLSLSMDDQGGIFLNFTRNSKQACHLVVTFESDYMAARVFQQLLINISNLSTKS
jgi:hypothetical protein